MSGSDVHRGEMFEDEPQLAAFAQDLRAAADAIPALAVRDDLAAVLAGTAPAPVPAWIPRRRRSRRSVTLRATIAGAAFGLGIGSLGVAGALPDPVQRQLSHAGDVVGVHLPTPADDHTSQGRDEEQQQAPGIRVVRPTTPAAQHNAGNDERDTPGTADNDGEHRGSTDDPNERGDEQRNEHATTTTTVGEDHRGGDEGKGDENSGGARVKNITTSTTIDDHSDNDDDTKSSDDVDGSSGSNSQLSR